MVSSSLFLACQLLAVGAALAPVPQANSSSHREAQAVLDADGCKAAVHKAPGSKASFLLEPLLCWRRGQERLVCAGFDYLRGRHFLRVPVLLTDPAVPARAKQLLAAQFPVAVAFMQLADVRIRLAELPRDVELQLEEQLAKAAGRSYLLVRVLCSGLQHCRDIRQGLATQPSLFFEQLRLTLSTGESSGGLRQVNRSVSAGHLECRSDFQVDAADVSKSASGSPTAATDASSVNRTRLIEVEGQQYLLVQQRSAGAVSFDKNWTDYENGFGNLNGDFWIGLRLLHSLTRPNRVLRVEVVRFRGATFNQDFFHAEYNDFRVGPPPLYTLSYSAFNRARSTTAGDALADSRGRGFSTQDRDNDAWADSCSQRRGGGGGWWFSSCGAANPNGIFYNSNAANESGIRWAHLDTVTASYRVETLKHIRILLRI